MRSISALAAVFSLMLLATDARADEPAAGPDAAQLFFQLDTNTDGQLSDDEVPDEQQGLFRRLLRTADANDDGKLSGEEFAAGLTPKPDRADAGPPAGPGGERPADGERGERFFDRIDRNGDGKVTLDEVPEERRDMFEKVIARLDKDGDKALTRDEFAQGRPGDEPKTDKPATAEKPAKPEKQAKKEKKKAKAEKKKAKRPEGKPSKPEGRPDADRLFGRLDKNEDGKITLDEVPEERREMFEKLISRADKDGDGAVSRDEFPQGPPGGEPRPDAPKRPGGPDGRPDGAQFFRRLDQNGDGKVTLDEVPGPLKPRIEQLMARADKDGDDALSAEELAAFRPEGGPPREGAERRPPAPGQRGGPRADLFGTLDADRDGKLSGEEISAAAQVIRQLDADADGSVTVEELAKAAPNRKKSK